MDASIWPALFYRCLFRQAGFFQQVFIFGFLRRRYGYFRFCIDFTKCLFPDRSNAFCLLHINIRKLTAFRKCFPVNVFDVFAERLLYEDF